MLFRSTDITNPTSYYGESKIEAENLIQHMNMGAAIVRTSLVFGFEDEIAPARITNSFAKTQENLKILGGIFENRFIDRERVLVLANLPSRNELLSRLVGSLSSSMTSFVRVLDKIKEAKSV